MDKKLQTLRKTDGKPDAPVLHFFRRTGRAERDEHAAPVTETEYLLNMNPDSNLSRKEALEKIEEEIKSAAPGAAVETEQPLQHLISHMLSGVSAHVAIKIYGDDMFKLRQLAEQVKAVVESIKGVGNVVIEAQAMTDELHVELRGDDLAFHGLSRAEVADTLQSALYGEVVSQVVEGQKRFDLVVKLDDPQRSDYARLGDLRLELPEGRGQVPLREVADVGEGVGPNSVSREKAHRRIVLKCTVREGDPGKIAAEIERRVNDQTKLPEGYHVAYEGQFQRQRSAMWLIGVLAAVAVVGMFAVLMVLFPSVRIVLQVLNALPTAFIGGMLALSLTGQTLTVAALVGFVSLSGIAVRNGILLMSHYVHLMHEEGEGFTQQMIVRGSMERLSPVLMTALTAGIALVPLVWRGAEPGQEVLYPVATVILGGLVTSTFCEFLIHPGLFWRFSGHDAARLAATEEEHALSEAR
jgi:HME family heavy-metal exporter